jgi:alpha-glucosidase
VNVEVLEQDPTSILHLYRRLIQFRRAHPALVSGTLKLVKADDHLLSFQRDGENERFLVLLNLGYESVQFSLENATIAISTHLDREAQSVHGSVGLRPAEGIVLQLTDPV